MQPFEPSSGGLVVTPEGALAPDLNIGVDPGFSGPNLNVPSGTASFGGAVTASSLSATTLAAATLASISVTGNENVSGNLVVSGMQYPGVVSGGTTPTASSQSASSANTPITMTSGLGSGGPNILYVQASGTSTASILLTPTSSASTSGFFQDGAEVTIINTCTSGSRLAIPSGNAGSYNVASLTISEGRAVRFKYIAALQSWIPIQGV